MVYEIPIIPSSTHHYIVVDYEACVRVPVQYGYVGMAKSKKSRYGYGWGTSPPKYVFIIFSKELYVTISNQMQKIDS